jgi:hypothetical protein
MSLVLLPERWAPVPGSPGYEVSTHGEVRRVFVDGSWRLLKASRNDCGYLKLCLGRGRQVYVHRIVIGAHVGPAPDEVETWTVDHIDFDITNNALWNLRYLTIEENSARHAPEYLERWWGKQRHRRPRAVAA